MSTRHTNLFIPSQARPQPANQPPGPPPPPEVKPRKVSDDYRGTNGFKILRYVPDEERQSWDQDRDDLAMWALENLGEAPPSLESLKSGARPIKQLSPTEIQTRISQRAEEHENDLRKLYGYQAHLREELLREHRRVTDGGDFYPIEELKPGKSRESRPVPPLSYTVCNKELEMQTLEFNDVVQRFIYAHQQAQLRLQEALSHAKAQSAESESQRRWDEEARLVVLNTRFPQSIEVYDSITNPTHKLRVSRLLVAPTTEEKEQIAAPFPQTNSPENWTEAECIPLMGIFKSDPQFAEKVHRYIQNSQSTDPRWRPTA